MSNVSFIRIPKNASTSIYTFFGGSNLIRNERMTADNSKYLNLFESSHCTINEAVDLLGDDILDHPVLAVVRNPYDRLVSMFFFAKKHDLGAVYDIKTDSFDAFADGFFELSNEPDFFHAVSQKDYIEHDNSQDFTVCRFESLNDDIAEFLEANSLQNEFPVDRLKKLNSTDHKNYREYYTDKSKSVVEKMWRDDLDHFSYCF